MRNYQPYKNYTNDELKELVLKQVKALSLGSNIVSLVNLAFDDIAWNPHLDFNGCNVVQDKYHPDPSCFIHDWLWNTGKGGDFSNELFYTIMLDEGYRKCVAKRRKLAVSIAWSTYFRFKKRKKSNISMALVKITLDY